MDGFAKRNKVIVVAASNRPGRPIDFVSITSYFKSKRFGPLLL